MSIWLAAGSTGRALNSQGGLALEIPLLMKSTMNCASLLRTDSSLKPKHLGICTAETQGIASKPSSATEYQAPQFRHHSLRGADPAQQTSMQTRTWFDSVESSLQVMQS